MTSVVQDGDTGMFGSAAPAAPSSGDPVRRTDGGADEAEDIRGSEETETMSLVPTEKGAAKHAAAPKADHTGELIPRGPLADDPEALDQLSMLSPKVAAAYNQKKAEEDKLWAVFQELDEDGSGTLDKKEVKNFAKAMGDNLKPEMLRNAFAQMDKLNTGEVTFNQFKKWWFLKKEDERKAARKKAREIFDAIDIDKGGTLDVDEMRQMAKTLQKKFPKIELIPPFNLERDFAQMDTAGHGEVTYKEFEAWWKSRTGDDDPDIPVLPESMVKKINDLAKQKLPPLDRTNRPEGFTGKELWRFLIPRLKQMVELEKRWGDIHALYPNASSSSIFEDKPIPPYIRDPDGAFATYWDLVQVIVLLYVSFSFPFTYAFDIITSPKDTLFWWDLFVDCYFYCDLALCFRTAYWTKSGILETDTRAIRNHYLQGWFTIDVVSCLPITYVRLRNCCCCYCCLCCCALPSSFVRRKMPLGY